MTREEIKELHDKTVAELQSQLAEVRRELAKAKLEQAADKLEDINLPAKLGDDVARIKTVLREKQLIKQAKNKLAAQKEE